MKIIVIFLVACSILSGATISVEAETMTRSGPYAGLITSPFQGVSLYGNNDQVTTAVSLSDAPGRYRIDVRGASSTSASASATVLVDATSVGSASWSSSTPASVAVDAIDITSAGMHTLTVRMDADTGASDAFIDSVSITRIGSIPPPRPAPVPATVGALTSGVWRNLFAESGRPADQITAKVEAAWQQLFYGSDATQRIYYPVGTDKAYILDTGNNDVRSEGMSYGMMICAQLDRQTEFDRLWRWASTYMRHASGERRGYFSWQCSTAGAVMDPNPASDGESYFVTALVFAHGRWGSAGSINYLAEANAIWEAMFNKELAGEFDSTFNLFDPVTKQVRFVPYASSAGFTDPSYHLPAFYEVWRRVDVGRSAFWSSCITASRKLFHDAANTTTGLMPDYSEFTGAARSEGNHADFRFDAWRCAMNWAMDHAWNAADPWQIEQSNRLLAFFAAKGIASYGNQWTLTGNQLDSSHSPGLVAMNAVAVLSSNQSSSWAHLDRFWDTPVPTGQYRYYDGCLYLLGLIHCSGKFRAWLPAGTGVTAPEMDVTRSGAAVADGSTDSVIGTAASVATTLTYSLTNSGTASLTVSGAPTVADQANATASIITYPVTNLSAGASTTMVVSVTPTAAGAWSFTVSTSTNDSDENPYNWTVSGTTGTSGGASGSVSDSGSSGGGGGCGAGSLAVLLLLAFATLGLRLRR